ncbi:uncharacterized protein LOC142585216 isoform X3 [Dermacentor variabilis]|uniref:uncharacterized protein LOC142585216 isoform X3 n=1 Tax=Dermacentor variabilis TaxID=34621 RepID=UPI003F5BC5ED
MMALFFTFRAYGWREARHGKRIRKSEAAGSFTQMQMLWFIIHTVSTPLAGATRPHTEPHVLGALCRAASTHAEVASFTELQPLDSSYRPVSTYLTGATRSHAGPQVLGTLTNDIRHPDATLKGVERAAMTWFRHAAK